MGYVDLNVDDSGRDKHWFMQKITRNLEQRRADGTWYTPVVEEVHEAVGTQSEITYIDRR